MNIPEILHQLWIGDASIRPTTLMQTWVDKHPDFAYTMWDESEIQRRLEAGKRKENQNDECFERVYSSISSKIDDMPEINGKADILRWAILYAYGGVFCDADSVCIEPVHALMGNSFAGYENEHARGAGWSESFKEIFSDKHSLIALGCVGFTPRHELPRNACEWIVHNEVSHVKTNRRAWFTVGPGLITRLFHTHTYDVIIYPSHYFLPNHYSGIEYSGHDKVYAHQMWGSTKRNYSQLTVDVPRTLLTPKLWVSILVSSYNTRTIYVQECLKSIQNQTGHIGFEVVWIDDGSTSMHASILQRLLKTMEKTSRFIQTVYEANEENMGIGYSLQRGLKLCSHKLVVKMDSDDIMLHDRIERQVQYMNAHPECEILGAQLTMFDGKQVLGSTNHKSCTWVEYKSRPYHWIANHPTLCYRKSCAIRAGGYREGDRSGVLDDFEFELRMLKVSGKIHQLPESVLMYRLHGEQVTKKLHTTKSAKISAIRELIITHHTQSDSVAPFCFQTAMDLAD